MGPQKRSGGICAAIKRVLQLPQIRHHAVDHHPRHPAGHEVAQLLQRHCPGRALHRVLGQHGDALLEHRPAFRVVPQLAQGDLVVA